MPLVLADRVVEQTTTQGTNNFELIGTGTGYQAFSVVGNGSTVYYTAEGVNDDGTLTGQWEVGQGVYNAGVLSRDTILSSSTGSKVSFSAGQKNVFIDLPSEKAVVLDDTDKVSGYNISGGTINGTSIGATTPSTGRFTSVTTPSVTATTNDLTLSAISTGAVLFNTLNGTQFKVNDSFGGGTSAAYWNAYGATAQPRLRALSSSNAWVETSGTGSLVFATNSGVVQQVVSHTASAVNYVQVTGNTTTNAPVISSQGSDTNINLRFTAKGDASSIFSSSAGSNHFRVYCPSAISAVNNFQVTGAPTNQEPVLSAQGNDTNINIALQPKGTGSIDLASGSTGVNVSNGTTVTAITRTAAGSGYTSFPTGTISAPNIAGGVQATFSFTLFNLAATISSGGTGYTVGDVLTVVGGTTAEPAMQFTVSTVSAGVVTAVTVSRFASYSAIPTNPATTTGGTGTGCTLNITYGLSSTSLTITNAGSGYTSKPTVTFSGGGGSGASAYATVGGNPTIRSLGTTLNITTPTGGVGFAVVDSASTGAAYWAAIPGTGTGILRAVGSSSGQIGTSSGVPIQFTTSGLDQFRVAHTASAVNYVQVTGGATTANPAISAQGSDTNVSMSYIAKGSGQHIFATNGTINNQQLRILHTASTANYATVTGGATGVAPAFSVAGTDTNIDLSLTTKGTGAVNLNTGNGTAFRASQAFLTGTAVNYIDASGRQTGLGPILSVNGSDTNVRFNITSKGNEAVGLYTNLANQLQFNVTHTASAVNYVQVTGGATVNDPVISAQGSDANIRMILRSKGTLGTRLISSDGSVQFATTSPTGTVNFLQVAPSATGSAPILSAQGFDTNIDLSLASKGTGGIVGSINSGTFSFTRDTGNNAIKLTATNTANLYLQSTGGGAVLVNTSDTVTTQLRVTHTASAVNYVQVTGSATTSFPIISAQGADTNISLQVYAKGTGGINFWSNNGGSRHFQVAHTAGTIVNYGTVTGSVAGSSPVFSVAGSDTNIDLTLTPKGTGRVKFGTHTATADTAISGYIEILDAGGTVRRLAVIS